MTDDARARLRAAGVTIVNLAPKARRDPGEVAILGIDPGLDGGIAWVYRGGADAAIAPVSKTAKSGKRHFDVKAMVAMLKSAPIEIAVIESVSAAPMRGRVQGTTSMFSFGRGVGIWEGILAALSIPYVFVGPRAWKKAILAGTAKDKMAAIMFAQTSFPRTSLYATSRSRVPHDGMADAICIAEYGRRMSRGL